MTRRALILGFLGAAALCGFTYFNDCVLHQSLLISDHMPVVIYGGLILLTTIVNPLLRRGRAAWALAPKEVAVILALVLAVCCIPAFGLLRTLSASLILPHHQRLKEPSWRDEKLVEMVPPHLLADVSEDPDASLTTFIQGRGDGRKGAWFSSIPAQAWRATLAYWLPLVLCLWLALMALAVVLHTQWSSHEHLPYPIARFADELLAGAGGSAVEPQARRLFRIGCFSVLAIYAWNYIQGWHPFLVPVATRLDLSALGRLFPAFIRGGGGRLLVPTLRFMPIGLAFFLAGDVALSLGVGPFLWCLTVGLFAGYGIALESGTYLGLKTSSFINFGAYLGCFVALLYWGRHYYLSVARAAFGRRRPGDPPDTTVWAARLFVVFALAFTALLRASGMDLILAVPYAFGTIMIFVVISRITAETGLFFIQVYTFPCVVLWGLLGTEALGPKTLVILCLVSCILLLDPREALMPYMVNSIRLLDVYRVRIGPTVLACAFAVLLGLAIAVPVTLHFQYEYGLETIDGWTQLAATFPFTNALQAKHKLKAQGVLEKSEGLRGFGRLRYMSPERSCVIGFGAGLGLVLLFYAARIRTTKWPLHPVLFLVWGTYPAWRFAPSFLLGWLIKTLVTRYGGARLQRRLSPLFVGLIAGEILGYLFGIVAGLGYYFITGTLPRYSVWR